ncbi:OmpA family protein [Flavobacterium branchiicola]|uniref:OmpA family protein n=1 Tax=Flavobacterium branchiicola TaxID=1114875 RepID=A0ABV9PF59_9FLAO|nr:OmpA family protein [Flavobacterium branchiicola]MBS7254293.1 OmpA family protein [Flavobacterium branchiicola]
MSYKNIKNVLFLLLAVFLQMSSLQAQDRKLENADKAYNKFAFIEASKLYEKLIKDGNTSIGVYTKLGDCYYFNAKYPEAVKAYSQLMDAKPNVDPQYYFRYAQSLNNSQKYDQAAEVMKVYYNKAGKKDLSQDWTNSKLKADIGKQSGRYILKDIEINTGASDFGTAFDGTEKVIYASAKDSGVIFKRKHSWNNQSFLKLYSADITKDGGLTNSVMLKGGINTKYHQSSPAITKDGKTMFFTRNNYKNGKLGTDKEGTSFLKIYVARFRDGEWKDIQELGFPINSDAFSSAHPALNPDETQLYFVSDRNNKFGDSDIYTVSLKKGGFVGNDVVKLGDEINTPGRETYPYIDENGILFFSSDGHPGLGGLDVFAAMKDDKGVYHVVNAGDGVNTTEDDFAYSVNKDKKGYFSSDRKGNDDIYGFTETRPVTFDFDIRPLVYGTIKDSLSGKPLENVAIDVYNIDNEKVETFYTDKEGQYKAFTEPFKDFKLVYSKQDLAGKEVKLKAMQPAAKKEVSLNLFNERQVVVNDKLVTIDDGGNLTDILNLLPIYFDYNGYKIRESSKAELKKVIDLMKARPNINIKINSYTDSRGKDDFNMKLSQNRAKATVDYIINGGVSVDRVSGEGFGETRLINGCSNGVKCTEKEHELNRRSEFIVTWKQ